MPAAAGEYGVAWQTVSRLTSWPEAGGRPVNRERLGLIGVAPDGQGLSWHYLFEHRRARHGARLDDAEGTFSGSARQAAADAGNGAMMPHQVERT